MDQTCLWLAFQYLSRKKCGLGNFAFFCISSQFTKERRSRLTSNASWHIRKDTKAQTRYIWCRKQICFKRWEKTAGIIHNADAMSTKKRLLEKVFPVTIQWCFGSWWNTDTMHHGCDATAAVISGFIWSIFHSPAVRWVNLLSFFFCLFVCFFLCLVPRLWD